MENTTEQIKMPRYAVTTNGSRSYFQVVDAEPAKPWESDVCTVWGSREKAERIARGLNLLDALKGVTAASSKAQIMEALKAYMP